MVSFNAPLSTGGLPIIRYTATCGSASNVGTISPIVVAPLVNDTTYTCYVAAQNAFGVSALSTGINVTPFAAAPLVLNAVQSRKVHQGGYVCDIPINFNAVISGPVTVEPRSIGDGHLLVLQFNNAVQSVGNVAAFSTTGNINVVSPVINGNEVYVTLGGVSNNQRVQVNLTSVSGASNVINTTVALGYLLGDLNGSRSVNATDIVTAKSRSNQTLSPANCAADVNLNGTISSVDVSAVKARSGSVLPPW